MERAFTATADYTVMDRSPLELRVGDRVRAGNRDAEWDGWIWAAAIDGRGSYVPEEVLKIKDDGTAEVVQPFHSRDLSVKKREEVVSLREVRGWHWCRNEEGAEGWLPEYLLKRANPTNP